MNIGMTLPVMEPGLTRKDLETWTSLIDTGPWSHIALGERIVFPNPEFSILKPRHVIPYPRTFSTSMFTI